MNIQAIVRTFSFCALTASTATRADNAVPSATAAPPFLPAPQQPHYITRMRPSNNGQALQLTPVTVPQNSIDAFLNPNNRNMTVARQFYFDQLKLAELAKGSPELRAMIREHKIILFSQVRVRYFLGYIHAGAETFIGTWSLLHPVPEVRDTDGTVLNAHWAYPLSAPFSGTEGITDTKWIDFPGLWDDDINWRRWKDRPDLWNRVWVSPTPVDEIPNLSDFLHLYFERWNGTGYNLHKGVENISVCPEIVIT
jgi:hypothetical protein